MRVYVKTLRDEALLLYIKPDTVVQEMKVAIEDITGFPPLDQRLIFFGRELENGCTCSDYLIRDDSTINLALRLRGGQRTPSLNLPVSSPTGDASMEIFVNTLSWKQKSFSVKPGTYVEELMMNLNETEAPACNQYLIFLGKHIDPGHTLAEYGIQSHDTIHLALSIHGRRLPLPYISKMARHRLVSRASRQGSAAAAIIPWVMNEAGKEGLSAAFSLVRDFPALFDMNVKAEMMLISRALRYGSVATGMIPLVLSGVAQRNLSAAFSLVREFPELCDMRVMNMNAK